MRSVSLLSRLVCLRLNRLCEQTYDLCLALTELGELSLTLLCQSLQVVLHLDVFLGLGFVAPVFEPPLEFGLLLAFLLVKFTVDAALGALVLLKHASEVSGLLGLLEPVLKLAQLVVLLLQEALLEGAFLLLVLLLGLGALQLVLAVMFSLDVGPRGVVGLLSGCELGSNLGQVLLQLFPLPLSGLLPPLQQLLLARFVPFQGLPHLLAACANLGEEPLGVPITERAAPADPLLELIGLVGKVTQHPLSDVVAPVGCSLLHGLLERLLLAPGLLLLLTGQSLRLRVGVLSVNDLGTLASASIRVVTSFACEHRPVALDEALELRHGRVDVRVSFVVAQLEVLVLRVQLSHVRGLLVQALLEPLKLLEIERPACLVRLLRPGRPSCRSCWTDCSGVSFALLAELEGRGLGVA